MSKEIVIGAAGVAMITAGAAYYVSPAGDADLATPPILLDMPADQALDKVRTITAERYLHAVGAGDEMRLVRLTMSGVTDREATATISFDSERVLVIHAEARPLSGDRSELDLAAELPESRFTQQPILHPYDLKVLAAIADLAATDYVSSLLKGQRMASARELEKTFVARTGLDEEGRDAFGRRAAQALKEAYGSRLEAMSRDGWSEEARWREGYGGSDPTPSQWQYEGSDPSAAAERAAGGAANSDWSY